MSVTIGRYGASRFHGWKNRELKGATVNYHGISRSVVIEAKAVPDFLTSSKYDYRIVVPASHLRRVLEQIESEGDWLHI
jgi:hypothetical protein